MTRFLLKQFVLKQTLFKWKQICYKVTQSQSHNVTKSRSHKVTKLDSYKVKKLQRYNVAILQHTKLQSYKVKELQSYNAWHISEIRSLWRSEWQSEWVTCQIVEMYTHLKSTQFKMWTFWQDGGGRPYFFLFFSM